MVFILHHGATPFVGGCYCDERWRHRGRLHQMHGRHVRWWLRTQRNRFAQEGHQPHRQPCHPQPGCVIRRLVSWWYVIILHSELLPFRGLDHADSGSNACWAENTGTWTDNYFDCTVLIKVNTNQGVVWTPSKLVARLGKEINNPASVYYWAYKVIHIASLIVLMSWLWCARTTFPSTHRQLPMGLLVTWSISIRTRTPASSLTLLLVLLLLYSSLISLELKLHLLDLRAMNNEAVFAKHTGMVILGGGLIKHHICNANLMVCAVNFFVIFERNLLFL